MGDGKWSGGTQNREWKRPGSRVTPDDDKARSARLAALLADVDFLDEVCGRVHPLAEHAACRDGEPRRAPR